MTTTSIISMILILTITIGGFIFLARMAMKKDETKEKMNG